MQTQHTYDVSTLEHILTSYGMDRAESALVSQSVFTLVDAKIKRHNDPHQIADMIRDVVTNIDLDENTWTICHVEKPHERQTTRLIRMDVWGLAGLRKHSYIAKVDDYELTWY